MGLNLSIFKINKITITLVLASFLGYYYFAYYVLRTDYIKLLMLYGALFFLFFKLVHHLKSNITCLTYLAFGLRAVFILAIPNLSQDFYRFIWDGQMIINGYNPYLYTVESFISQNKLPIDHARELHEGMGPLNAMHFTNYPPLNQLCFVIANLLPGNSILSSVVGLRLIIIGADFGTLFYGKKILKKLNLPVYNIFWYILNPFILIELTGNLHFEGVMIFFLIWSLYFLFIEKWQWAALLFGLSISVKLIPLIFLPLFYQWFIKRKPRLNKTSSKHTHITIANSKEKKRNSVVKLFKFYGIIAIITIWLFIPFYSTTFMKNYSTTVALWFQNFEFNASLYYLAREIGYFFRGYNEIAIIGKFLALSVVLFVTLLAFFRINKNKIQLITAMLLALTFYYFTATTVHPWYIATLLILSIFTKYRFPLIWSFIIILSYLAYININKEDKTENLWIIALEYGIVYGVFIWEVYIKKASKENA